MRRIQLKHWESFLIALSVLLFLVSSATYVTDFPLRNYLFDLASDDEDHVLIGHLVTKSGSMKRQFLGESEFKSIDLNSPLYNMDILVTGPESGATLQFENGDSIEMGPSTMIRLAFQTGFNFDGVNRYNKLDVVAGTVKGQAGKQKLVIKTKEGVTEVKPNSVQNIEIKNAPVRPPVRPKALASKHLQPIVLPSMTPVFLPPPVPSPAVSPSPSPSPEPSQGPPFLPEIAEKIRLISPKHREILRIQEPTQVPVKVVQFAWKMAPVNGKALLRVWKHRSKNSEYPDGRMEVFKKMVTAANDVARITWKAESPGWYEWKITAEDESPISYEQNTHAAFYVEKEFEGIKTTPALVGGRSATTNKLSGDIINNFDITLRWEQLQSADQYKISFSHSPQFNKVFLERATSKPEFTFNKDRIFTGQLFFKVKAQLPSGFVATSNVEKFSFSFLPPLPVVPANGTTLTQERLTQEGKRLLFTWQKTNFTLGYELEISHDQNFRQSYLKKSLKENYLILPSPPVGRYWWRVRSFSKDLTSPMSQPFQFTILK